jgi:hypothetical protein
MAFRNLARMVALVKGCCRLVALSQEGHQIRTFQRVTVQMMVLDKSNKAYNYRPGKDRS